MSIYNDYIQEIEDRKAQGLHPKPIDSAELLSAIIEQIKDTANEYRADSLNFFIYNTLPGTTSAAGVKAKFLKEIILGESIVAEITPTYAFELLSHMKGGPSIEVLLDLALGNDEATAKHVAPILDCMGGQTIYMGKMGNASVVKVVTNMLAFIHLVAAGEAMMLPAVYGVDPDATYRAIRASSGNSFVHETESKLILSGSYNVKFTMDLACKDLGLVNDIAKEMNVPLELGGMTQQIFRRARGLFGSEAQSPEVVKMLEQACGIDLRAPGYPTELVAE